MIFKPDNIYHIHNRTFNNTLAFPTEANYRFFREKMRSLANCCDLLCYCLMPDHFDFIVYVSDGSMGVQRTANGQMQVLSRRIGTLLSSYTLAYNKQLHRRGSLFQPKTKSNPLNGNVMDCFDYIHQKPIKAGLAFKLSDWEFSSYREHQGSISGSICNKQLAAYLLDYAHR